MLSGPGVWRRLVVPAVFFALAGAVFLALFTAFPVVYDTDSAYHLAVARGYWGEGLSYRPPLRFGLLGEGGDKELLFHLLLAPFAGLWSDPLAGGRVALALLVAAVLTTVGALARTGAGGWGWLLAAALPFASLELFWRLVRLRPELLSLTLVLAGLTLAAARRYRWLAAVGALYALSYTAVHAFVGIFALAFLWRGWARRDWDVRLVVYPAVGVGLGLLAHPDWPRNLVVWVVQNLHFFARRGALNVGTEIRPNLTDVALLANLAWLAGLGVLLASARPVARPPATSDDLAGRRADLLAVAAVVFTGLYLLMSRFSIYAVPLVTLALLAVLHRRGLRPGGRVALPGGRAVPAAVAWGLCLLLGLPGAAQELGRFAARASAGPRGERLADRAAFGAAVAEGARVAADWGPTGLYLLLAPQGRYLNALDPIFMADPWPGQHAALRRILDGEDPDVPFTLAAELDSDHLALPRSEAGALLARLDGDPRLRPLHPGSHLLYEVVADANRDFLLDWRVAPPGARFPPTGGGDSESWMPYPRPDDAGLRAVEGFVQLARLGIAAPCVGLVRQLAGVESGRWQLELAAWGPTALWLDGEAVLSTGGAPGAMVGRGIAVPLDAGGGDRLLAVLTCRSPADDVGAFALRLRERPGEG